MLFGELVTGQTINANINNNSRWVEGIRASPYSHLQALLFFISLHGFCVCVSLLFLFFFKVHFKCTRSREAIKQPAVSLVLINQSNACQDGRCTWKTEGGQSEGLPPAHGPNADALTTHFLCEIIKVILRICSHSYSSLLGTQTQGPWVGSY